MTPTKITVLIKDLAEEFDILKTFKKTNNTNRDNSKTKKNSNRKKQAPTPPEKAISQPTILPVNIKNLVCIDERLVPQKDLNIADIIYQSIISDTEISKDFDITQLLALLILCKLINSDDIDINGYITHINRIINYFDLSKVQINNIIYKKLFETLSYLSILNDCIIRNVRPNPVIEQPEHLEQIRNLKNLIQQYSEDSNIKATLMQKVI